MEKKRASTRSTRTAHTFGAFDVDQINKILCVCGRDQIWKNVNESAPRRAATAPPPRLRIA